MHDLCKSRTSWRGNGRQQCATDEYGVLVNQVIAVSFHKEVKCVQMPSTKAARPNPPWLSMMQIEATTEVEFGMPRPLINASPFAKVTTEEIFFSHCPNWRTGSDRVCSGLS